MSGHRHILLGNIHDIRVPVPGTSASEFEAKETGNKKKGEDKNINWNLQVLQHPAIINIFIKSQSYQDVYSPHHSYIFVNGT